MAGTIPEFDRAVQASEEWLDELRRRLGWEHSDPPEQAVSELRGAMEAWLEVAREHGFPIAEPRFRVSAEAADKRRTST